MKANKQKYRHVLLYALLAFVLYGNTLRNSYAIDDHYVTNNDEVKKGLAAIPKMFKSYYASNENSNNYEYRPVVKATFALEYQLFKNNVAASHFINVLLYACCLVLFHAFLKRILLQQTDLYIMFLVCLFAVLPVHAEVVASLKNRDIMLSFIFALWSFLYFERYFISGKIHVLGIAFLLALVGFLSKYDILPFVFIAPVLLFRKHKTAAFKSLVVFVLIGVSFWITVFMKKFLLDATVGHRVLYNYENPLYHDHSLILKGTLLLNSLGFYVKNLVFPSGLACYYGNYTIPLGLLNVYGILGILALIAGIYFFLKDLKKGGDLWSGLLLFFIPLAMYLQVFQPPPGIVADRFCFVASIGFVIVLGYVLHRLLQYKEYPATFQKYKPVHKYAALAVMLVFAACVWMRNKDWKNTLTLYAEDVKKWPASVKLNILYGNEIMSLINTRSDLIKPVEYPAYVTKAQQHLTKAYELDSTYYNAANTLAFIELSYKNDPQQALHWLYKSLRYDSINYEIPLNMCLAYVRLNNVDSAEVYYSKTIKLNPGDPRLKQMMDDFRSKNRPAK